MRAVVQRVSWAHVKVAGEIIGTIQHGLCVLVGALDGDSLDDAGFIAHKLATLRIFTDAQDKLNLDVRAVQGSILLISQFTLAADTTSGTRPSFSSAMPPAEAARLLNSLAEKLRADGITVATGSFGAKMEVELLNSGPVTILLDSRKKQRK